MCLSFFFLSFLFSCGESLSWIINSEERDRETDEEEKDIFGIYKSVPSKNKLTGFSPDGEV